MISNICIVGLLKNYTKKLAKRVADTLEMFYADVEELLTFDLIDLENAENVVGKQYIEKQETNKIKTLASYDNTVITLDYLSLNKEQNLNYIVNGTLLIYLKIPFEKFKSKLRYEKLNNEQKQLEQTLFNEREKVLLSYAEAVVNIIGETNPDNKLVMKGLKEYYEKR